MKPYSSLGRSLNTAGVLGSGGMSASQPSGASVIDMSTLSLTAWWEDTVVEAAGLISQVTGKASAGSSGSNNLTAAGVNRPTLGAALGSQSLTWSFDGTSDVMAAGGTLDTYIASGAYTMWIVFSATSLPAVAPAGYTTFTGLIADSAGYWGVGGDNTPRVRVYNYDGTEDYPSENVSLSTWVLLEARHEGGTIYTRINNGTENSAASGNTGSLVGTLSIGARGGGAGGFFPGSIAHISIADTALDSSTRAAVRARNISRYAIT